MSDVHLPALHAVVSVQDPLSHLLLANRSGELQVCEFIPQQLGLHVSLEKKEKYKD